MIFRRFCLLLPTMFVFQQGCVRQPDTGPPLEASTSGWRQGKPPLRFHKIDVVLRNPFPSPRWLLLHGRYDEDSSGKHLLEHGSELSLVAWELSNDPRLVMLDAKFTGVFIVQLPGDGVVRIDDLVVESGWHDVHDSLALELWILNDLRIDGKEPSDLLGVDTASASGARVEAPAAAERLHSARRMTVCQTEEICGGHFEYTIALRHFTTLALEPEPAW